MAIKERNKITFKIRLNSLEVEEIYQKFRQSYFIHDKPNKRSMNSVLEQLLAEGMLNYMNDNKYLDSEIV